MLQAMLHHKLTREEEGMEDLLTSNTFGLMKYLPPAAVLLPFLRRARNPISGDWLETELRGAVAVERWRFWPTVRCADCASCEPDVEIILRHEDGSRTWLLVEVKYRSGKSSVASEPQRPPNDQLAREFDNLRVLAQREQVSRFGVVFVTADFVCPIKQLEESTDEYRQKRHADPRLYWLSWRTLPEVLESELARGLGMAQDLRLLLLDLDLTTFCRLRFEGVRAPAWHFGCNIPSWEWAIPRLSWRLGTSETTGEVGFRWELSCRPDQSFQWRSL